MTVKNYNKSDIPYDNLINAIKLSDYEKVHNIINMYCWDIDFNGYDKFGMTALHHACIYDYNSDIVCTLLSLYDTEKQHIPLCNRNIKDGYNRTPLIIATINGSSDNVELMCRDLCVDINSQDTERNTALHIACTKKFKNVNIIDTLLKYYDSPHKHSKISVSKKNINGNTPLMLTLEYTDISVWRMFFVRMDINREADVKYISSIFDGTFFKKVIECENIKFVDFLVDAIGEQNMKILLDTQDLYHMKPIHYILDMPKITSNLKNLYHKFISLGSIVNDTIMADSTIEKLEKKGLMSKIKNRIKKSKNVITTEEWQRRMC